MRRWNAARRNTPPFALEEKSGLGLRAGEADCPVSEHCAMPNDPLATHATYQLLHLGKPFDFLGNGADAVLQGAPGEQI